MLLQLSDGRFELSNELAARRRAAVVPSRAALAAACGSCGPLASVAAGSARDRVWATALVVAALERRFAAFATEWELLARRSRAYVGGAAGGDGAATEVLRAAASALAAGEV